MKEFTILNLDGKQIELPIITGSQGEKAIDISKLRGETGYITYDNGFKNTGSCISNITYIDGEKGILKYRGIPIEELANKSTFTETAFLVINGHLPTKNELENFSSHLNRSSLLHEDLKHFFEGLPNNSHPMASLSTIVSSLSQFHPIPNKFNRKMESQFIANLISQVRTIAAFSYKKSIGEPFEYPSYKYKFVENFLHMMFSSPVREFTHDKKIIRALELFLILHVDHEQNCSTSTVRIVGSSGANIYSAVSAGISALWGPLHGGANQEVIQSLENIHKKGEKIKDIVEKVKNKKFRLMGFGHRVYKNFDPRARILKKACDDLLNSIGYNDPLFEIAKEIESIVLKDEYFISRNLYPNVDFYSGLILKAIGIPINMFTVIFAMGRMPGWLAQWKEMYDNKKTVISRPRQIYKGIKDNKYIPINKRKNNN